MNSAWLMAIGTGVCNSGVALSGKSAERSRCRPASYALIAFSVAGAMAFVIASGLDGNWSDWRLWAIGMAMGFLYLVAISSLLHANRYWPPSIVWSAANMAFVAPIFLSGLILREPLQWMDALIAAGVALMLIGLADPAARSGRNADDTPAGRHPRAVRPLLLAIVFAANGLLMFGYKLFHVVLPEQRASCLVAAVYGCAALLAAAAVMVRGGPIRVNRAELGWGLCAGAAAGLAALALLGAMQLPAATAFPVIQGTSLAGGVLLCALVFRERLTLRKLAALAIGLGAMTLTMWR